MERIEDARSGEVLDDKKEKSKKKKSKVAQYISLKFSKLFKDRPETENSSNEQVAEKTEQPTFKGRFLEMLGVKHEEQPENAEREEQVEEAERPTSFERFKMALSRLNIFERPAEAESPAEAAIEDTADNAPIAPEANYGGVESTVIPQVAEAAPSVSTTTKEKRGPYFSRNNTERRKMKKSVRNIEKEIEQAQQVNAELAKDNESMTYELEELEKDNQALEDRVQRLEQEPARAPQTTPEAPMQQPVIEKAPEQQPEPAEKVVEQARTSVKTVEESAANVDRAPVTMQTETPERPIDTESNELRESAAEQQSKHPEQQGNPERAVMQPVTPEILAPNSTKSAKSEQLLGATGSAAASSSPIQTEDREGQSDQTKLQEKLHTDNTREMVSILIVVAMAIAAFSVLAFIALN